MPVGSVLLVIELVLLAFLLGIWHERRYTRKHMPEYWRWRLHKEAGAGNPYSHL